MTTSKKPKWRPTKKHPRVTLKNLLETPKGCLKVLEQLISQNTDETHPLYETTIELFNKHIDELRENKSPLKPYLDKLKRITAKQLPEDFTGEYNETTRKYHHPSSINQNED